MKRLLLSSVLSAWAVPLALATTNYINYGTVSILSPPQIAPQIDASNFVNYGTFYITNEYSDTVQPPLPYESWNTRNWTNANRMAGDSGFRFDYFDSVGQTNGWSASFQNAGNVNPTNANIFGAVYVLVSATNVNNKGTMAVTGPGLMTLAGKNVDLSRGIFAAVGNETNDLAGVLDDYWGVDNGDILTASFSPAQVSSSFLLVTEIQLPNYVQVPQNLQLTSPFTTYIMTNTLALGVQAIDVLFLRQTNPAITTEVRFGQSGFPGVDKIVRWQALMTNRVTKAVVTNQLYLQDTFAEDWGFAPFLVETLKPNIYYTLLSAATYHPYNYSITHGAPPGYANDMVMTTNVFDPLVFYPLPLYATNAGYAATLTAAAFNPDPTISGSTFTNVPGRIQVSASGPKSYLDLTWAQVNGESYLLLSSTNHFVGSTNATIVSPISDIYLASTNGMMAISNLTTPFIPRICGQIAVWSGRWTNITPAGFSNYYNVTMIDSQLIPEASSQIQNLNLRSTNLLVGDVLNVFGSLLIDAQNITISTNAANAPTPNGEINLTSGNLLWSANLPTLAYLTNYGGISSVNSIFFGGARTPPWFSGTYNEPYQAFVTHGSLQAQGDTIWANYFEASGTNDSGVGPVSVQATTAIVTNGAFLVTDADITFTCGSLLISNQVLEAGRSIALTVTNYLNDGSLSNSVTLTNSLNIWTVGGGINLLRLPPQASLLATIVTNTAYPNAEVDNYWAGKDYGLSPAGFANNAALGRLTLDGQDNGSIFAFWRTGLTNALYVDLLELKDATATNVDNAGDFVGVNLQTNFTIYYGDAVWNGKDIAEQLNGRYGFGGPSGGRFLWVSNYNTGFFSSTYVTYTDGSGTHRLNRALVESCDIDSNGNGIYNCMDSNPVPVLTPSTLVLKAAYTNYPTRSVVLSWDTIPLASNYLYASSLPLGKTNQWQLITNFLSGPALGARETVTDAVKTNGVRYYRVEVLSP
jgi:hypothetical protein